MNLFKNKTAKYANVCLPVASRMTSLGMGNG